LTLSDDGGDVLVVEDLTYAYDRLQVLFGISFRVRHDEVLGLLGTNGAGKSTLLRAVTGLVRPPSGRVVFNGLEITGLPAERLVALGIAFVQGGKANFPDLTVRENLEVGAQMLSVQAARERIERELERFPVLRPLLRRRAASLSGGEQQQLAIAKALLMDCQVLCIDELSLGLSPRAVDGVLAVLRGINRQGVTIVIVEQSLQVAAAVCTRVLFLEKGRVRFEGAPGELAQRGDLARAVFLGAGHEPDPITKVGMK
jgi:ABC-type branched-subunit amino acid transport system ATPase component